MPVQRVLVVQCAMTLLFSAGLFYGWAMGLSALLGGLLCVGPNAAAAAVVFRTQRARSVPQEQRRMQLAWAVRWVATLAGFGILLSVYPQVRPGPLFAAYAATLAAPLIGHWIYRCNLPLKYWHGTV